MNNITKTMLFAFLATTLVFPMSGMTNAMAMVEPTEFNDEAQPGDEFVINKLVTTPEIPPKLDLLLLEDESGSFGDDIATIQGAAADCSDGLAADIWDGVSAEVSDLNGAVAGFSDFSQAPYGVEFSEDHVYRLVGDMTGDKATWLSGICNLNIKNGGDFPESQYPALTSAANGIAWDSNGDGDLTDSFDTQPGQNPTWRMDTDVTRVIVLVTDADPHDSDSEGAYPGTGFTNTVAALNAEGIHVIVLTAGNVAVYADLATQTGGSVKAISSDSSDIVDAVLEALAELKTDVWWEIDAATCSSELNVNLVPEVHFGVTGNTTVAFTETIGIPEGTPGGEYHCDVDFIANTFGPDGEGVNIGTQTIWIDVNSPPVCDDAVASTELLWPPNHKMNDITINGVTDSDGDDVTITISSIFQDESTNDLGDGDQAPDGDGVGTDTAQVRAERAGLNDNDGGRVYHISFNADDGNGGMCSGTVTVGVPHDKKDTPVDDGMLYDSTLLP
jgi:hypothetical protein